MLLALQVSESYSTLAKGLLQTVAKGWHKGKFSTVLLQLNLGQGVKVSLDVLDSPRVTESSTLRARGLPVCPALWKSRTGCGSVGPSSVLDTCASITLREMVLFLPSLFTSINCPLFSKLSI